MRFLSNKITTGFLLSATTLLLAGCVAPGRDAPESDPFGNTNATATVLIFVSNDCPISNRYAPEIERLKNVYAARNVNFWLVHADPAETSSEIRHHARQYGLTMPTLRDPGLRLATLAHARVTPTAALFGPGGTLLYHGRIDDRAVDLGKERAEPTRRDLAEAIDAVLAGRPVLVPSTEAVGCIIPNLR